MATVDGQDVWTLRVKAFRAIDEAEQAVARAHGCVIVELTPSGWIVRRGRWTSLAH